MQPWQLLLAGVAGWMNRRQQQVMEYLVEENRILREQIGRKRLSFSDSQKRRLAAKAKGLGLGRLKGIVQVASPETLLRWYRELIAGKYDGSGQRGPGRPSTTGELRALVIRMAKENRGWGYTRIQGALAHLGHEIGRTTIREILLGAGLAPAPERRKGKTWKEFLQAHWNVLSAVDFFEVEVLSLGGLQRYWVMVVMELCTRRVTIAGIIVEPTGAWVEHVARGLADGFGGVLAGKRYLIHDRGAVFTEKFQSILAAVDVKTLKLPARAPNLNAHLERWIRSIREECLDHLILFSEASLRKVVGEYVAHFHRERPHQGLGNEIIEPEFEHPNRAGEIWCRKRLGGLLKYYYREEAA
jgi:putative transposase